MKHFTVRLLTLCFSLTAFFAFSQVPNDECSGAIPLILGQDSVVCDVNGSTEQATVSAYPAYCCVLTTSDVWYKFAATSESQILSFYNITKSYFPQYFVPANTEVYKGSCNSLELIQNGVVYSGATVSLSGLTPGDFYYIRVYSSDYYTSIDFDICLSEAPAPANDECSNAVELTPATELYCNGNNIYGNTLGATSSMPPCGTSITARDIWFKFTATSTGHILESGVPYGDSIQAELFSGTCGSLTSLKCSGLFSYSTTFLNGLTVGDTYFIRIYSKKPSYSTFSICLLTLPLTPVNDECANALSLMVGTVNDCMPVVGSTLGATSSLSNCSGTPTNDIWYSFTATSAHVLLETLQAGTYTGPPHLHGYALYSGTCGQLTSVTCSDISERSTVSGLTVGETYYLRIFSAPNTGHTLSICVRALPEPPANDDCSAATLLEANMDNTCTIIVPGTTLNASQSIDGCTPNGASVWYSFTAGSGAVSIQFLNQQALLFTPYLRYELYSGDCNNLTFISCRYPFTGTEILPDLIPGATYFIKVTTEGYSGMSFDLCLKSVVPPVNDDCSNAATLTVDPPGQDCSGVLSGTTLGATLTPSTGCFNRGEVWFTFTATQGTHTLRVGNVAPVSPGYFNYNAVSYGLYSGDCNNRELLVCNSYTNAQDIALNDLIPGETYLLFIAPVFDDPAINFDLCILTPPAPPANDACVNAVALTINSGISCDVVTSGTTVNATDSPTGENGCYGTSPADVWYTFTAAQINHEINFLNVFHAEYGYSTYLAIDIYTGDCQGLTKISSGCFLGSGIPYLATNLTPGQTYYMSVRPYYPGISATFDVCITTPPPPANDNCSGAEPVQANLDLFCSFVTNGNNYGATPSGISSCGPVTANDVWFSFEAASSSYRFDLFNINYYTYAVGAELLEGDCNSPVSVRCQYPFNQPAMYFDNLTIGNTYYIRIFTAEQNPQNFSICLRQLPLPPSNDNCAQAIEIEPNPGITCDVVQSGNLLSATTDGTSSCSDDSPDVWYSFTAAADKYIIQLQNIQNNFNYALNPHLEIFTGVCGNLVSVECIQNGLEPEFIETVPGETYFIRVSNGGLFYDGFSFDLCLRTPPPPPTNIYCGTATELTPNIGLACDIITLGSTVGVNLSSAGACTFGNAVWFSFTATQALHILDVQNITAIYGSAYLTFEIFKGTTCSSLEYITCTTYNYSPVQIPGLVPGEKYYIRIYNPVNAGATFDICLKSVVPPGNDQCADAAVLNVHPDLNCTSSTPGTSYGAGQTTGTFCTAGSGDVWYQFTATQASHIINLNNVTSYQYGYGTSAHVEVFDGSCGNLEPVACRPYQYGGPILIGDLTAGATYLVRILAVNEYEFLNFDLCITTPPPPPANDACSAATAIVPSAGLVCENPVPGSTLNATPSWSGVYEGFNSNDVWYSFTATSTNHFIEVSNILHSNFSYYEGLQGILYAAPCITQPALGEFTTYASGQFLFTNLVPGQQYVLRLYNYYQPVNFDLCITTPPVPWNDECANALPANINTDLTCNVVNSGTTLGASSSMTGCEEAPSNDVWYQFTAPSSGMRISYNYNFGNSGFSVNTNFEVYSGACGNLSPVQCSFLPQNVSTLSGLIPGETYYIRVYSRYNGYVNFDLCLIALPDPPANNECTGAYPVAVNPGLECINATPGTTLGATASAQPPSYCGDQSVRDVWFTFTASSDVHILDLGPIENVFQTYNYMGIEIFSGSCNNLTSIYCSTYLNLQSFPVQQLTPGQTYYVRVYSGANDAYNFSLCIKTPPPPPANANCETPVEVTPNAGLTCDLFVSGQTASVANLTYPACGVASRGLWYEFTATSGYHIISLNNIQTIFGAPYPQIDVFSGPNCVPNSLITCGYGPSEVQLSNLIPGEHYTIRVGDGGNGAMSFDLCIKSIPAPVNDNCSGAIALTINPDENCTVTQSGSTAGASVSGLNSCNINSADVWYSFVATQGSYNIHMSNVLSFPNLFYDSYNVEVYKGDCNNPELVQCWDNLVYYSFLTVGDLQAGETYYVRIGGSYQLINFDICITTPPPPPANDACGGAFNIPVSATTTCETVVNGTSLYATASQPPISSFSTNNDVWYSFTALGQNHTIHLSNIQSTANGFPSTVGGAVYDGTCGSINALHFFSFYQSGVTELSNLTPGTTYYLRIFNYEVDNYNTFDICMTTPPAPINDECSTASVLFVNNNFSCDSLNYGTLIGATPSQSGCITGPTVDAWHTFLATGTDMRLEFNISPYTNNYTGVEVLEGNCGTLNSIYCGLPGQPLVMHNLTPGNSYFVRVYAYANTGINYTVCLFDLPPVPVNDLCENAIEVIANPGLSCDNFVTGSTGGLNQNNYLHCYYGTDMWYKFTAINQTHLISVDNVTQQYGYTSLQFEVFSDNICSVYTGALACSNAGNIFIGGLIPGSTYYIRVVGTPGSGASFDVCVRSVEVPENDDCEGAIALTPAPGQECTSYVSGTTVGATPSVNNFGCFPGNNDVWYSFTATSLLHNLTLQDNNQGYPYGLRIELFENGCGNPVLKDCYILYSSGNIQLLNLVPGQTYYLRIASYPTMGAEFFDLCITTLPVDLSFYSVENQNGTCTMGSNENVYINFYNNSPVLIPAGYVTGTLQVSGMNNGNYGPLTNQNPVSPYSIGSIQVSGVNLSNTGLTQLAATVSMPDDNNPSNNSGSNTLDLILPFTIYPDFDNDGYGDDNNPVTTCTMYYGYTTTPGDCNDSNAAINPAATEVCNGYDDDCDGEVDETTLDVSLSASVIPCGGTFATLTATATGGAGDYQFSLDSIWSGSVNEWQVGPGTHLVIAYDAYGCGVSETITIAPPNNIVVAPINVTHVSCQGGNSGAIDISVSGGSGVYSYLWSNNKTTQDIVNLAAGTYTVVVTDNQGCTTSVSAVVNPRLTLTATKTNAVCYGSNTGTATAVPVGGTPGYSYLWSNGATTATINNLSIGNYTVTVTDALGCTRKVTTTISQPLPINISTAITNAVCYQQPGGAINITVTNATPPLSYLWSDGATTEDRTAVVGGTYTVTVTDANGCSQTKVSTVTEPAPITATFSVKNTKCNGGADGEITANINGGTRYPANNQCNGERYCIQWSNGATSRKITGLTAGVYTVTITDLNGCSLVTAATVTEPAALVITNVATQTLANGKYKVTITATGGTPNYKYKRTPGPNGYQTSNVFNNVPPGSYVFEVSDNNNCTTTTSVNLPVFFHSPSGAEDRLTENSEEVLGISMLPNPATDVVQIVLDTDLDNAEITVFDLQGRQIHRQEFSGTATTIQLDGWSSGMYLVEIRTNGERYVRKLSVVR